MAVQQAPAYAASPLGSFPELSQMYATNFSTPVSDAQMYSQGKQDEVTVENQKRAEAAAKEAAAAFADKNKYTIKQRADGGFGFYGPDGKQVTAAQYANNTGQKLTDVLKDSNNPIDQRYIADHNDLTAYLQAKAKSKIDPTQKSIADNFEKLVKKQRGIDLSTVRPGDAIQALQSSYPTIYGGNTGDWSENQAGYYGVDIQNQKLRIGSNVLFPVVKKNSVNPAPTYGVSYPGGKSPNNYGGTQLSIPQGY